GHLVSREAACPAAAQGARAPGAGAPAVRQRRAGRLIALLPIFLTFVAVVEAARRLPLHAAFRDLGRIAARAVRITSYRKWLESRKERALQAVSLAMFRRSLRVGLLLVLAVVPIGLLLLLDGPLGLGVVEALASWRLRIVLLLMGLSYGFCRFWFARRLRTG